MGLKAMKQESERRATALQSEMDFVNKVCLDLIYIVSVAHLCALEGGCAICWAVREGEAKP